MVLTVVPPTKYERLYHLCASLDIHLAITAILAGETPAHIYADDPVIPKMALILPWDGHRVYLVGTIKDEQCIQEIRETLLAYFKPFRQGTNVYEFLIYAASSAAPEMYFSSLWRDLAAVAQQRCYYRISPLSVDSPAHLPSSWRVRQIDSALLAEQQLQHLAELIEEMHSESPSREDFLAYKFGYCVQEGDELLGWCLSEYNHADRCEIGIETVPAYRRHGVAFITASALIAHAWAQGITSVGWHCWSHNTASRALALKLGGVLVTEYTIQRCRIA